MSQSFDRSHFSDGLSFSFIQIYIRSAAAFEDIIVQRMYNCIILELR